MKKIYTSYYTKFPNDPLGFSVSRSIWASRTFWSGVGDPRRHLKEVAPEWWMVEQYRDGQLTKEQYTEAYLLLLDNKKIDPFKFINKLPDGAKLLCYENPTKFCHRHILAKWLTSKTGIFIEEWVSSEELRKREFIDEVLEF